MIESELRYLAKEQSRALFNRILGLVKTGGETSVWIDSSWCGNLRWARNRPISSGDTTDVSVKITRDVNGAGGSVTTNKLDDASLTLAIASAERIIGFHFQNLDALPPPGPQQYLHPDLWSNTSYELDAAKRSHLAQSLVSPAREAGLLAAGYIQVGVNTRAVYNTRGMDAYYAETTAEYSTTIRDVAGTGSGWAGTSNTDWSKIASANLTSRAQEGCVISENPRAVEPGRYTAIFQPQAVHDLLYSAIKSLGRVPAEQMHTVYTLRPGQSKIGLKIFDERITISTDPMDPECGYIPFDKEGYPFRAVKWVEHGVLKQLAYDRQYALAMIGDGIPLPNPFAYRVDGGSTSVDEMIATTKRGLLVTRFSNVLLLDAVSLQSTGVTRDGFWLVENGKITTPVKNMRFVDSPMFAFNTIDQIGTPARVYAEHATVVPAIKVHDFNFAVMSDAV